MIVAELQPSGFTFAAKNLPQALDWAAGHAHAWPSTAVRLFDWRHRLPDQGEHPETMTVPL